MPQTVLALVGENANGILRCQSRRFGELLEAFGLRSEVLEVGSAGFGERLERALGQDVRFVWGYAGVGARLRLGERCLWDAARTPFVSVLADAPYIMPPNHDVRSRWVVNGYVYDEWLDFQRRVIRSPQISTKVPLGVIPNAATGGTWGADRPIRMLFVKTGADPDAIRRSWQEWPKRLQGVLHGAAEMLQVEPPGPIAGTVSDLLAAEGLSLEGVPAVLHAILQTLDGYVRAWRATAMVRALLPLPVDIVGDGWDHVREDGGAARFHGGVDASALDGLYAQARALVNVTPNFASGPHERVVRGFASGCEVVSDQTAFSRAAFAGMPSFRGVDCDDPALADQVAEAFHAAPATEESLRLAADYVRREHAPEAFLARLIELAELARAQPAWSEGSLDAA